MFTGKECFKQCIFPPRNVFLSESEPIFVVPRRNMNPRYVSNDIRDSVPRRSIPEYVSCIRILDPGTGSWISEPDPHCSMPEYVSWIPEPDPHCSMPEYVSRISGLDPRRSMPKYVSCIRILDRGTGS